MNRIGEQPREVKVRLLRLVVQGVRLLRMAWDSEEHEIDGIADQAVDLIDEVAELDDEIG